MHGGVFKRHRMCGERRSNIVWRGECDARSTGLRSVARWFENDFIAMGCVRRRRHGGGRRDAHDANRHRFASPECGRGHLAGVHGKMFQYITLLCRRVRLGDVYRTSCARKRVAIFCERCRCSIFIRRRETRHAASAETISRFSRRPGRKANRL